MVDLNSLFFPRSNARNDFCFRLESCTFLNANFSLKHENGSNGGDFNILSIAFLIGLLCLFLSEVFMVWIVAYIGKC